VDGLDVQIPVLFWKVVYYTNDGKTLNKVGFLMGQEDLLDKKGIVKKVSPGKTFEIHAVPTEHFLDFEDAETYQVSLTTIEKLSGLKFSKANEPYKDPRPIKLILEQVEMKNMPGKGLKKSMATNEAVEYKGMIL
jgi:endonuclease G